MPTAIHKHGIDAHLTHHDELGRVWVISHAGKTYLYVRHEEDEGVWVGWTSLDAMREGVKRTFIDAPKLETIMRVIAMIDVNKDAKESAAQTREIDDLVADLECGENGVDDPGAVISVISDHALRNPDIQSQAIGAISRVLAFSSAPVA